MKNGRMKEVSKKVYNDRRGELGGGSPQSVAGVCICARCRECRADLRDVGAMR